MSFLLKLNACKPGKLNFLLLLTALILPGLCFAQAGTDAVPIVDHVAICVKNLKKSTAFYTEVMHLRKVANPFKDTTHQWYSLGNGVKLHAIQSDCSGIHPIAEHLCFSVGSVHEFAKTLESHNVKYSNWKGDSKEPTLRADGVLQLYFQDPDGYWIEINSPAEKK